LNSKNANFFRSLVERDQLVASLDPTGEHAVVVSIVRIAVEKFVQALVDAMEHLSEWWHAVIIGPQYVPLERLSSRVHLLPAQRRIGNWLGIADVLCHPSDYESHCFSINEAWLAGVPVVSCDYLVNRQFEQRHGPLMWLMPTRPDPVRLATALRVADEDRHDPRVSHARDVATREYSAPVMGRRWSHLVSTVIRRS
jgi:glycosyltransferase involved in cell wall biosynthesis